MMNLFKKYISYIQNNPKNLWFKRKLYGWGWTPVMWQGWAVVLIFIGFVLYLGFSLPRDGQASPIAMFWFFAKLAIAVGLLIFICYKKGEKPKWQWGFTEEENEFAIKPLSKIQYIKIGIVVVLVSLALASF